jgi:hypothetical protein
MAVVRKKKGSFELVAHRGDRKTLLAFDLKTEQSRQKLAGFTVFVEPPGVSGYYLLNNLQFEKPELHVQVGEEPVNSSVNAPIHKFRWVHHPGLVHQGLEPALGSYRYTVTPRYFDNARSLLTLDATKSASVKITVDRFTKGDCTVGFTRGFVQSQAYRRHFGSKAPIVPADHNVDLEAVAGANEAGESFTYAQQRNWLGFTARDLIYEVLDEVEANTSLKLDVFAYDLDEPGVVNRLLQLAPSGRVRVILDNAALHHSKDKPTDEDDFEVAFSQAAAGAGEIKRGKFGRYAHDKVLVVSDASGPRKVLTGSTNFSFTGLYVNSNHVLVFNNRKVASTYARVFDTVWETNVKAPAFKNSELSQSPSTFAGTKPPTKTMTVAFSPHDDAGARATLDTIVSRVGQESNGGNVLFALMQLKSETENPVYESLAALHESEAVFSYGISDAPAGITLYEVGKKNGVLVTGKPAKTVLPPPFLQVPSVSGHQVHHKFVVCGINGADPVVFCGSSNLALGGEQENGDNLLEIDDADIAMVFAIEALELVDHFAFLNRVGADGKATVPAHGSLGAAKAGWFLSTTDRWASKYFDPNDLRSLDRTLFAR